VIYFGGGREGPVCCLLSDVGLTIFGQRSGVEYFR
jgi:hypothetical protein